MRVCSRLNTEGLVLLALVSFQSHFCACIHRGDHAGLQKQRQLAITLCFSQSPKIIHNSSDSSCFSRWASRCPTFRLQREKRSTKFLSLQRRVQLRYSLGYEFIHYLFLSLSRASFISGFFIRGGFISGTLFVGVLLVSALLAGGSLFAAFSGQEPPHSGRQPSWGSPRLTGPARPEALPVTSRKPGGPARRPSLSPPSASNRGPASPSLSDWPLARRAWPGGAGSSLRQPMGCERGGGIA